MKQKNNIKKGTNLFYVLVGFLSLLFVFFILLSAVYGILTSFKDVPDYTFNKIGLPKKFLFSNYEYVFKVFKVKPKGYVYNAVNMFGFTIIYCAVAIIPSIVVTTITAYVTARFRYKFSDFLYVLVAILMSYSVVGSQASELKILRTIGLYDSFVGIALLKANFLGIYYLVLFAMFRSIPNAYSEAAKIDGAGNFRIFITIMLPLARGAIGTIALLSFVGTWNDYQIPLVYLPSYPNIATGLFMFINGNVYKDESAMYSQPPVQLAASMVVFIPMLVLFIIFQKKIIGGISIGGIKE